MILVVDKESARPVGLLDMDSGSHSREVWISIDGCLIRFDVEELTQRITIPRWHLVSHKVEGASNQVILKHLRPELFDLAMRCNGRIRRYKEAYGGDVTIGVGMPAIAVTIEEAEILFDRDGYEPF